MHQGAPPINAFRRKYIIRIWAWSGTQVTTRLRSYGHVIAINLLGMYPGDCAWPPICGKWPFTRFVIIVVIYNGGNRVMLFANVWINNPCNFLHVVFASILIMAVVLSPLRPLTQKMSLAMVPNMLYAHYFICININIDCCRCLINSR